MTDSLDVDPTLPGFWLRAGGYFIDSVILLLAGVLLSVPLVMMGAPEWGPGALRAAIALAYFTVLPLKWEGQTIGKRAAGLAIARADGSPLTVGRLALRWLGYFFSALTAGLGFLAAAFTQQRRALHDYVAGTRVVRVAELSRGRKAAVIVCGVALPIVAMAGILAAVAIPQFSAMQGRARDLGVIARLGQLRTAEKAFQADAGRHPDDLSALAPKYIDTLPAVQPADHPATAAVERYGAEVCSGQTVDGSKLRDTGRWGYVANAKAPCAGAVFVDCTHSDSQGKPWYLQ